MVHRDDVAREAMFPQYRDRVAEPGATMKILEVEMLACANKIRYTSFATLLQYNTGFGRYKIRGLSVLMALYYSH